MLLIVLPGFLFALLLSLVAVQRFRMAYLGRHEYLAASSALHEIHLFLAFWAIFILSLLLAMTFGGKALETAVYNVPTRSRAMTGILFVLSAIFCAAVALGAAVKLVSPNGYRGVPISQRSEHLAYRLNGLLRHQPKVTAPGGDSAVAQTNRPSCAPCLAVSADGNARVPSTPKPPDPISVTPPHPIKPEALIALFLPLTLFGLQFLAIRLQLGLLGRSYEESRREWLARFGAWGAIVSFGWFGMGAIALLGPPLYYWFFDISIQRKIYSSLAVLLVHAVTLYAGSSSKTSGKPNPTAFFGYSPLDLIGLIGAPIAILSLLLIFSGLVDIGVNSAYLHMGRTGPFWLFLGMTAVLLLFGRRIDVNEFSLHPFYRDRLARCYLGATNGMRTPDPFTGFDDHSEASIHTGIGMGTAAADTFRREVLRRAVSDLLHDDQPDVWGGSGISRAQGSELRIHADVQRVPRWLDGGEGRQPRDDVQRFREDERIRVPHDSEDGERRGAGGGAAGDGGGDLRRGAESEPGVHVTAVARVPDDAVQCAAELVDCEHATAGSVAERLWDAVAAVRAGVSAARALRALGRHEQLCQPVRRRPLRQHGDVRAGAAAMPADCDLRRRAG